MKNTPLPPHGGAGSDHAPLLDDARWLLASLPTAAQPYGAVFQPGCIFHCGPITNAQYARMSAGDGTTLRDALRSWFEWTVAETETATEQRRWVDTEGAMAWPRSQHLRPT